MLDHGTVDFGIMAPSPPRQARFTLRNTGHSVVSIETVEAECGCTSVRPSTRSIEPGELASVDVTLDASQASEGAFQKRATLTLHDSKRRFKVPLSVTGQIDSARSLTIFPSVLDLGVVVPGEQVSAVAYLHGSRSLLSLVPERIEITDFAKRTLEFRYNHLDADLSTKAVTVTFRTPTTRPSVVTGPGVTFLFIGNVPIRADLSLRIAAKPKIYATPASLYLKIGATGVPFADLVLHGSAGEKVSLSKVTTDLPLAWDAADGSDGLTLRFHATDVSARSMQKQMNGVVRIETGQPAATVDVPVVFVPILEHHRSLQ